jgi:hypothetical protein
MNDRFSHNFHYQITGWKVCDVKRPQNYIDEQIPHGSSFN